jgi:hypothetical protein
MTLTMLTRRFTVAAALILVAGPARASVILTATEVGSDVVFQGGGTIDLTDLTFYFDSFSSAGIRPNFVVVLLGSLPNAPIDYYQGIAGPAHIGPGIGAGVSFPTSGSGNRIGVSSNILILPDGYMSGNPLSATDTFAGQSFASLGLTPGTYLWTWGSGGSADSLTIQIGAVPEPSSIVILGTAIVVTAAAKRRKRTN